MTTDTPIITRRRVIRRLGLDGEVLDRLEEMQLVIPVRRPGRERAYIPEDVDRLRVYCLLVRELGVNAAGAEVVIRMRKQLIGLRKRLALFLDQARQHGLLDELQGILDDLDDEFL